MKIVVLVGAPGAGKGTQAKLLTEDGYTHVSTGDMFRAAVSESSELGAKVRGFMDAGALVPDELVIEVVASALKQLPKDTRLLLDGFPRTSPQAHALAEVAEAIGATVDALFIEVPIDALIERLSGRRVCEACGQTYHVRYNAPPATGECSACGKGPIVQRRDDQEETVRKRLEVYEAQRNALQAFYESRGSLLMVNGVGEVDAVAARIKQLL